VAGGVGAGQTDDGGVMMKLTYTHKGWFGLCPVFIGDIEADGPDGPCIKARHWLLDWLFDLSIALMDAVMSVQEMLGREPEGYFVAISKKLHAPIVEEVPE
jgi:hypothetical protein